MAVSGNDLAELPPPGTTLAGKYLVLRLIGKGGMGVVMEARHLRLDQDVALKLLWPSTRDNAEAVTRFEREARTAARLQSRHVARIFDVDVLPDGCPFMVMELLHGRELGDELKVRGRLPISEAVGYILQACAAMTEAHRMGVIHRDLKPSNLFLCEHEGQRSLKVLDFGISKLTGDVPTSVTATGSAFGTPLYMSPEHIRSMKHVDARADIWSLGVVLFELLAGEPPFNQPTAPSIIVAIATEPPTPLLDLRPDVPIPLADAIMKALEKDPKARFADVREFAAALLPYGPSHEEPAMAGVIAELDVARGHAPSLHEVIDVEMAPPAPIEARKRRTVAALVGFAALVLFGVILVVAAPWTSHSAGPAPGVSTGEPTATAALDATPAPLVQPVPTPEGTAPPLSPTSAPTMSPSSSAPNRRKPASSAAPVAPTAEPSRPPDDPKYL